MSARVAFAILGLALALPALGCGHCVEDKIASVYDHAVVVQALGRGQHVAFFAVEGAAADAGVAHAAESTRGVVRGSARVSMATATLSMAFDPKRVSFGTLEQRLQRRLSAQGITLQALRIMERPAELKTVRRE